MANKLTREEKESLGITSVIFALLLILLFVFKSSGDGGTEELEGGGGGGGVTINFGDSEAGSGVDYTSQVLNVSQKTQSQPVAAAQQEEVLASDADDAPAVVRTPPVTKEPKKQDAKPDPVKTPTPPKPSRQTNDAMDAILHGNNKGGDGDDGVAGNKGKSNGDISSGSYSGDGGSGGGSGGGHGSGNGTGTGPGSGSGSGGGSGSGNGTGVGNYKLAGRKVLTKPNPQYTCNEQGVVVVQITVDQNGRVISAQPGARGTTNPAKCLADQAKVAAMNTKFDSSDSAPDKQVGTIIYNFKLTD